MGSFKENNPGDRKEEEDHKKPDAIIESEEKNNNNRHQETQAYRSRTKKYKVFGQRDWTFS